MQSALETLKILQDNVDSFGSTVMAKYAHEMRCQAGCSQCCHTEFSIFPLEALCILEYAKALDPALKSSLVRALKSTANNNKKCCKFLHEDLCLIYSARPIICRSQGLPLLIKKEDKKTNSIEERIDYCPLNFTTNPPARNDCLELERLNSLQVIANRQLSATDIPEELKKLLNKEGRIELKVLAKLISGFPV